MKNDESLETYLETIYLLQKQKKNLKAIDIVHELNYSKPSVSVAMKNLKNKGFITIDLDNNITLTQDGIDRAESVYERHVILTKLFEMIGVPSEFAVEDACKIEHIISEESFEYIKKFINKEK